MVLTHQKFLPIIFSASLVIFLVTGCRHGQANRPNILRVATTTSTRDSGLIDVLIPEFENKTNCKVHLIAVGTGKALQLGSLGEVDTILVHAKKAELDFVRNGHATRRDEVMFNYFEILGPSSDPAGIRGNRPERALKLIADSQSVFVSRGDDSGTHKRELEIWKLIDKHPEWSEYLQTGQGMSATLIIANEKLGYTLCDRGTYLAMKDRIELVPLAKITDTMKNQYGVLCIHPDKNDQINHQLANQFADFLISVETQQRIREFKINGESLFQCVDE